MCMHMHGVSCLRNSRRSSSISSCMRKRSLMAVVTIFEPFTLCNSFVYGISIHHHWLSMLMLQGSVKLLQLVSDYSQAQNSIVSNGKSNESGQNDSNYGTKDPQGLVWVLEPSKELEHIVRRGLETGSLSEQAISDICITFSLNKTDVLKYRDLV
ncbi:hypothetical protein QQP08_020338 [Theobroma cacao]|nr:hypothetical protein QQP08_020338 [Theobroma cacao]